MNLIQTIILSIVEGVAEFLPISSTGHLILTSSLLKISQTEFVKSFEIIIQLGAILAVVVIYFKKLILNFNLYWNLFVAFLPSAVFGLFFYKYIRMYLIGNNTVVIWSLLIGGIVMLLFERFHKPVHRSLSTVHYLLIGLFQVLSMIPGVSRAFTTIFGGMIVGLDRKKATEFSFLLAIPTMAAASGLDLIKTDLSVWTKNEFGLLAVGFVGSFLTAYVVIKWLIKFVQNNDFKIFGIYRIIIGLLGYWVLIRN